MRAMGPCESLKIETFAVLSYGKKLNKSSDEYKEIAFNMVPPSFEDNYPDNVVSKLNYLFKDVCNLNFNYLVP